MIADNRHRRSSRPFGPRTIVFAAMLCAVCVACDSGAQEPRPRPSHAPWNSTPNDINNLLRNVKSLVDADYSMELKGVGELSIDPEQNPIIYYSSHYNYAFTPEQREKLRAYMLNGGMMIFNTGLGSAPFYRSTRSELEAIFPEAPLQRLSPDHPLFHAYYDLDRVDYSPGVRDMGYEGNEPWIDGVTIDCRTVAVVSRFGLAVGWDGGEVKPEYAAYMPESALQMGVNIIAYATAMRAWAKNAARAMTFVDAGDPGMDKVSMAQVIYDGEWRTRHAAPSILLQTFNRKTGIPVTFDLKELRLSDPAVFTAPLLYMTGHEYFELNAAEMQALRKYLMSGGLLLAEACCGRKGFDLAFRRLMQQVLPEHRLQRIPAGEILFSMPNDIRMLGVTPTLAADVGQAAIPPILEGVSMQGHYAVIYSPLALAGGWEMSQSPYAKGYNGVGCLKLGQNVLMYAVTQ